MNTEAAVAEFSNMISQQGTSSPETAAPEATSQEASPAEQGAAQAAQGTQAGQQQAIKQAIENFIEARSKDGKTMKLPMDLEIALKQDGQMANVPLEKMLNSFRQAQHLQNKQKEYQTKLQSYEERAKQFDQYEGKYGAIQKWSEENPEAFEKLWQMFEAKDQILTQNPDQFNPAILEINALKQKLSSIEPIISEFQKQRDLEATQKDVALIETQIGEFKKDFPNMDLSEKDLDGIDLESRIIQHGIENGYKDFLSAAFTYPGLRQRLMDSVRANVKAETAKQIKTDTKNGILARSAAPTAVKSNGPLNVKRMSEDDRTAAALQEFERLMGA